MKKVIATIDVSRPSGQKIVRDLQNKKAVTLEYPLPEGKTVTLEEAYEKGLDRLSEHFAALLSQH
jgi:CTP-dependent riboflavin kinase